MTENLLRNWEIEHFRTIGRELREAGIEFTRKNIERVLNETSFTTRSKKHPKECPYYQMQEGMLKSCHPKIEADNFSCFLCSCPNYDSSSDQGKCRINSPQGKYFPVNGITFTNLPLRLTSPSCKE